MNERVYLDDIYTYALHKWEVVSSEVGVQKSRPVEPRARLYKHVCQSDCFGYKSWTGDWILMLLIHMININKKLCRVKLECESRVQ